jgi:tetratricopeptide (TPR) repeat protein
MARPELLAELKAIAPYERDPILELARIHLGAKPALAALEREVGPIGEYDRTVLYDLAAAAGDDLERYLPIGRRLCAMNPEDCDTVAAYLVDHDREPEAASLYRFFSEHARDRVGVSNSIRWLVMYDFENGRTQEATRLADEAADVYSGSGLATKAKLLERMEKFDAAEELLQKATTRYDNASDVTAFYLRRMRTPAGLKQFEAVSKPLVAKVFPNGMDHVLGPPRDDDPPTDGVRITRTGHRGAAAGFADEDLVVAVDGVWVHNYAQFMLVWRMSPEPEMSFLVFHDGKYREIRGALRDRWLSGSFTSYDWRWPILR